jgi:hypothetical protein
MPQGRQQVKKGRIARKAKRGIAYVNGQLRLANTGVIRERLRVDKSGVQRAVIVRDSNGQEVARHRQRFVQDGLADIVRAGIGGNSLAERARDLPPVVVEYFTGRSFLVLQLRLNCFGGNGESRCELRRQAERYGFRFSSVYGPVAEEEDGVVEIRLRELTIWDDAEKRNVEHPHARALRKDGWIQSKADPRFFGLPATKATRLYAVDFCWKYAGDHFTLSGVPEETVEYLRHGTRWSYPLEQQFRAPPSSGTTEHMLFAHKWRKKSARSKSDGIAGHEIAASRINDNGVRYIPRLYRVGKKPALGMGALVGGGVYRDSLKCERPASMYREIRSKAEQSMAKS